MASKAAKPEPETSFKESKSAFGTGLRITVAAGIECVSCAEGNPPNECPKSKRLCGHHCNHSWSHDACDWCGASWGDENDERILATLKVTAGSFSSAGGR